MKKADIMIVLAVLAGIGVAFAAQTKSDADSAAPAATSEVLFGARDVQLLVKSILAKSGAAGDQLDFYVRDTSNSLNPYSVSAAQTAGTHVPIVNTGVVVSNNDVVVIQWANGTARKYTVSGATATSVTINATSTDALTTSDKVYEMVAAGSITIGSNAYSESGEALYATPGNSPLWIQADGTNGNYMVITIEQQPGLTGTAACGTCRRRSLPT